MEKTSYEKTKYRVLIDQAIQAMENSYSPYSHYQVGAALRDQAGRVWQGCNIENASYTPTICAERTALFQAVSHGVHDFSAIAIVGKGATDEGLAQDFAAPCGVCRQALNEFCPKDFPIILMNGKGEVLEATLEELLPLAFGPENLHSKK